MRELGYIPMRDEAGRVWPIIVTNEPIPEPIPDSPLHPGFAVVQPFPVIETTGQELVVPPREYGTLVERPAVCEAA
jgi:hypothetical protein